MDYIALRRARLEKIKGRFVPGSTLKLVAADSFDSSLSFGRKLMALEDDNAVEILEYRELVNGTDDAIRFENGIFEIRNELYEDNSPFEIDDELSRLVAESVGEECSSGSEEPGKVSAADIRQIAFPSSAASRAEYLSEVLRETASPLVALLREDDASLKSIYSAGFSSGTGKPVFEFALDSAPYTEIFSSRRTLIINESPERVSELWLGIQPADLSRICGCCFVPLGNISGGDYLFFAFYPSVISGERVMSILKKINNIPDFA